MNNKVCMITGANAGIGRATALGLAKMGATVVMVCRNPDRGEAAMQEIRAESGNTRVELMVADLSSQAAIRQLASDFKARYSQLHVLVNNAGVAPVQRSVTADGIETTFAVNYLAPFLLTNLLLDTLKASAPARVVNVAGDFHRKATIRFDDLMSEKEYSGVRANNQAKLALILFTYELARRLAGTGVTANCLHPGPTATDAPLNDPDLPAISGTMYRLVRVFFQSQQRGAETSIYLASSPDVEGVTSKYFIKKRAVASSSESYDVATAQRLWGVSAQLAGLAQDLARRNA
jgi:NAD(P)-dependent dehydrogenase (short-subunit alcohol dehydrogenase family)